mmetsp:Transcript_70804/g.142547  ORF Transcript_70804/g.142547 Transcript_70804/m.142547 type:complete len:255 (+) Transcript_70804:2671-3435(+)
MNSAEVKALASNSKHEFTMSIMSRYSLSMVAKSSTTGFAVIFFKFLEPHSMTREPFRRESNSGAWKAFASRIRHVSTFDINLLCSSDTVSNSSGTGEDTIFLANASAPWITLLYARRATNSGARNARGSFAAHSSIVDTMPLNSAKAFSWSSGGATVAQVCRIAFSAFAVHKTNSAWAAAACEAFVKRHSPVCPRRRCKMCAARASTNGFSSRAAAAAPNSPNTFIIPLARRHPQRPRPYRCTTRIVFSWDKFR